MPFPRWLMAGCVALVLAAMAPAARAGYPRPLWSFRKPTPNVLGEKERSAIGGFEEPDEARQLRSAYPRGGLYRNDGTTTPLWTFDGLGHPENVDVASDGVHMIWLGRTASAPDDIGITFYVNGRAVRSYQVSDLVDDWGSCKASPGFGMRPVLGVTPVYWQQGAGLDQERLTYTLMTKDGNRFVFDARTGEIVSAWRPGRLWRWMFWTTGALAGVVVVARLVRWRIRRPRQHRLTYPIRESKPSRNPWETGEEREL